MKTVIRASFLALAALSSAGFSQTFWSGSSPYPTHVVQVVPGPVFQYGAPCVQPPVYYRRTVTTFYPAPVFAQPIFVQPPVFVQPVYPVVPGFYQRGCVGWR